MVLAFVRHTCGNPKRCQVRTCHLCGVQICDQIYTDQWCSCDECWKAHQAAIRAGQDPSDVVSG